MRNSGGRNGSGSSNSVTTSSSSSSRKKRKQTKTPDGFRGDGHLPVLAAPSSITWRHDAPGIRKLRETLDPRLLLHSTTSHSSTPKVTTSTQPAIPIPYQQHQGQKHHRQHERQVLDFTNTDISPPPPNPKTPIRTATPETRLSHFAVMSTSIMATMNPQHPMPIPTPTPTIQYEHRRQHQHQHHTEEQRHIFLTWPS